MGSRKSGIETTGAHQRFTAEMREKTRKAVVRMFLFQSKAPSFIDESTPLEHLTFTDAIFIKKSGVNNPNQLMPVGGKIDDDETVEEAARREVVEETHLRPTPATVKTFPVVQDYSFPHRASGTQKHRYAYNLSGRLLPSPMDVPYSLDPEEDKIASFERLSYAQVDALLREGMVHTDSGDATLLDSLLLNPVLREAAGVTTEQENVEQIHEHVRSMMRLAEADKKVSVFQQLLSRQLPDSNMIGFSDRDRLNAYERDAHALRSALDEWLSIERIPPTTAERARGA